MPDFNPQNRPQLVFIIEPDDEKRRLGVAGSVLEQIPEEDSTLTRRFMFEESDLPETVEEENGLLNCKRLFFSSSPTSIPFGSRWLEWTENIRLWQKARLRVGVDAFHHLIYEPDEKAALQVCPGEFISQYNAQRFVAALDASHHSSIEYILGVSSLEWLLVFLGVGSIRARDYALKDLLDLNPGKQGLVTTPSEFMRRTLIDQGLDELLYNRYVSLLFSTETRFPLSFGQKQISPPRELITDADGFYKFQPTLGDWSIKPPPADGKSRAEVFYSGNGTSG